ncbi:sigma-E factor negative regulatory protein [Variovorax ginsengisoli]|uniref:Sigma-E factor negative regulatory protein RseA n=1 Tax=Variovorax ginsengisoli TaxID=363844 RepID=A0ABT9S0C3_9BURK|nr:sigma-E factor negative regulatory protein [Variovorax ginsengisoli]MDP9897805.1 sigma-E factor negative regulatory protein RseA [Variovorax ginsengisoli]
MNHSESAREQVSALADGQLRGQILVQAVAQVCDDEALRNTWQTYHLIGDVMRTGNHAPCTDTSAFMARLQKRLAEEPPRAKPVLVPVTVAHPVVQRVEAANEPMFRWKLVAGAASLAAAAAIGWNFVGYGAGAGMGVGAELAQQSTSQGTSANAIVAVAERVPAASSVVPVLEPSRVVVGNMPQVMLRDPRLDQLLEAHQQAGGASQMPSGFLRNATFEGSSR